MEKNERKSYENDKSNTGHCGGSAIAAIAPVIDAKDSDIAYAMSATFLFDMAMIVLFPIMGRMMGLMVAFLGAIGMNTRFKDMKKSGINPMLHGFIISALVVVVAVGVEWCMGLV